MVASDDRGPTISSPIPSTCSSASRRFVHVDSTSSLNGPSSKSSSRSASRRTATYRSGCVTTAVTMEACPVKTFSSPRNPHGPCRTISSPAAPTIVTSPSMTATNGYPRSPTR